MKITSFDTGLYSVPLTESWGSSNYLFTSLEFVVVWLHTDTGHTGTGRSARRPAARSRNRYPGVEPANGQRFVRAIVAPVPRCLLALVAEGNGRQSGPDPGSAAA
jgi:hypothetical protein